jgi:hypothetical protein
MQANVSLATTSHSLSRQWKPEEDEKLLQGIQKFGRDWKEIARQYFSAGSITRTPAQCYDRYRYCWKEQYAIEEIQLMHGPIKVLALHRGKGGRKIKMASELEIAGKKENKINLLQDPMQIEQTSLQKPDSIKSNVSVNNETIPSSLESPPFFEEEVLEEGTISAHSDSNNFWKTFEAFNPDHNSSFDEGMISADIDWDEFWETFKAFNPNHHFSFDFGKLSQ